MKDFTHAETFLSLVIILFIGLIIYNMLKHAGQRQ